MLRQPTGKYPCLQRAEAMMDLMETVESQKQAFHEFPQVLGNLATPARFPHCLGSDHRAEKWKTQNQVFHFPSLPFNQAINHYHGPRFAWARRRT